MRRADRAHPKKPGGRKSDPRKVSVVFNLVDWNELAAEAKRQDRTFSWLIQKAWRRARVRIRTLSDESTCPMRDLADRLERAVVEAALRRTG